MGIVERRGKTWSYRFYAGKDPSTLAYRRRTKGGFRTKKEAAAALSRAESEYLTGASVDPSRQTVAEYLRAWLLNRIQHRITPKTAESYGHELEKHVIPALGALKLEELRPQHLQSYYTKALKSGRKDGAGGLSPTTVRYHHRILTAAFTQAVRLQALARNPCDSVDPPTPRQAPRRRLPDEDVLALLSASRGTWLHLAILLAASFGLRRGEVAGLRWDDIDWQRGTLTVRRSLEQLSTGELRFKPPKTNAEREQVLGPVVQAILREYYQARQDLAVVAPDAVRSGLLFCKPDGTPFYPSSITHAFARLRAPLGITMRFQDLRHFQATFLLRGGIPLKIVSTRLGHSSVRITGDLYTHADLDMQRPAAQHVDTLLLKDWKPAQEEEDRDSA